MSRLSLSGSRFGTALFVVAALSSCTKARLLGMGSKESTVPVLLSSIFPSTGPVSGGTTVTITGSGFTPGMAVSIGGNPCTGVKVISGAQVQCTTSASVTPGVDAVSVITLTASATGLSYTYLGNIQAVATTISSGGVFSTSGTIRVRATIGAVSGAVSNNMQTGTGIIKLGGIQGVIKFRN